MLSVALLSKWHVHWVDYMNEALQNPRIEIVRIWDEDPERGKSWADDLGVAYEKDLDRLERSGNRCGYHHGTNEYAPGTDYQG